MSGGGDDVADDLFHCCALTAFVDEACRSGGRPDPERTRRRAYALYERELAARHGVGRPAHLD